MQIPQIKGDKVLHPELSYKICGLCFSAHNELGRYRNEKQYADAIEVALKENKIIYIREKRMTPSFEGENCCRNIPDFIIDDKIVLDLKAKAIITKEDYFQMRRYLASGNFKLGIVVNFRQKYLRPKRILSGV